MPFKITITEDAERQFRSLPVRRDQRNLEAAILSRLEHPAQPHQPKAIKQFAPLIR